MDVKRLMDYFMGWSWLDLTWLVGSTMRIVLWFCAWCKMEPLRSEPSVWVDSILLNTVYCMSFQERHRDHHEDHQLIIFSSRPDIWYGFGFSVVAPKIPNYVKSGANDVIWYEMRNLVFYYKRCSCSSNLYFCHTCHTMILLWTLYQYVSR
jgi:hypothetical protein